MTKTEPNLPMGSTGTESTRFNALNHGILSQYTVLPWEDAGEYQALLVALVTEHTPLGPTEEHLVEEIAGIMWRKRRLRLAEAAAHRQSLKEALSPFSETVTEALAYRDSTNRSGLVVEAIRESADETAEEIRVIEEDEDMTSKALKLLRTNKAGSYEKAVAALSAGSREWWEAKLNPDLEDLDEDRDRVTADAEGLRRSIENELLPWYASWRKELDNRPLVRAHAYGLSFDPEKMARLARYEVHLDRKLERTLALLYRLKDLRGETVEE